MATQANTDAAAAAADAVEGGAGDAAAADDAAAGDAGDAVERAPTLDDMDALMGETPAGGDDEDDDGEGDAEDDADEPAAAKADAAAADDEAKPAVEEKKPAEEKPADAAALKAEAAKLEKGFKALARDRQKMHDRERAADAAIATAEASSQKAGLYDQIVSGLASDPYALLQTMGGDALIDKLLEDIRQGVKSPAERAVERLQREAAEEKAAAARERAQRQLEEWTANQVKAVQDAGDEFDIVNSLGLHETVVEVMNQYCAKHSPRDKAGNFIAGKLVTLTAKQAAKMVEDHYAQGLAKSKKFAARGGDKPPGSAAGKTSANAPAAPAAKQKAAPLTLSSVTSGDAPHVADDLPQDDNDRFNAVLKSMAAEGTARGIRLT